MALLTEFIVRIVHKFKFAFKGLIYALTRDRSIRLQFLIAIAAGIFFHFIGVSQSDWLWIMLAIWLVILTEYINSIIEQICDVVQPKPDPRIAIIKDLSASMVLIAALFALIVAIFVLL